VQEVERVQAALLDADARDFDEEVDALVRIRPSDIDADQRVWGEPELAVRVGAVFPAMHGFNAILHHHGPVRGNAGVADGSLLNDRCDADLPVATQQRQAAPGRLEGSLDAADGRSIAGRVVVIQNHAHAQQRNTR
jgi:hypothetical protein